MKKTCKVMLCRFPGFFQEHPDSVDWMIQTYEKAKHDPRISEVLMWKKSDTPITMSRNKALEDAKKLGVDYVLMLDADMKPDQEVPGAVPFWDTAFNWMFDREPPAIIAAPYCGGGSYHNNIFIFRWNTFTNNLDWRGVSLEQFTRSEAMERGGIEEVGALPTGVMLMDMRILERMSVPYFDYEWQGDGPPCEHCGQPKPGPRAVKGSTEDVMFTRDASMAWHDVPGAGCFCLWDSWAEHIKPCHIGKPIGITADAVGWRYRNAMNNISRGEHIRVVDLDFPQVATQQPQHSPHEGNGHVSDSPGSGNGSQPAGAEYFRPLDDERNVAFLRQRIAEQFPAFHATRDQAI